MEIKKSAKASLENKKLLFTEIGLVLALLVVYGAFNYSSKEAKVAALEDTTGMAEVEEMVAIQNEPPPPPPEAPNIPVLSDQIDIVDDEIKVDDLFVSLEDDANTGVEIMDYKEEEVQEEEVEEEAIPFQWLRKNRLSTEEMPTSSPSGSTLSSSTLKLRRKTAFPAVLPSSSRLRPTAA